MEINLTDACLGPFEPQYAATEYHYIGNRQKLFLFMLER